MPSWIPFGRRKEKETAMSNNIPVVQGVAVPSGGSATPYVAAGSSNAYVPAASKNNTLEYVPAPTHGGQQQQQQQPTQTSEFNGVKGEEQPKQFQDVGFAILFYIHLAVMAVVLSMGTANFAGNGGGNGYDYSGVIFCVMACALCAVGLSTLALGFMFSFATELVKVALIFSVVSSLLLGLMGLLSGDMMLAVMGFASFAIGICYAYFVWARIPFAAANLRTALAAVRANLGLAVVAYIFLFLAFGWTLWWIIGLSSALYSAGAGILFLYFVSYYWTHQVITNTVHVTTAGVIGTWWFIPDEASTCCSPALMSSFVRATTYSFGSICFGSLIVAIIQALRALQHAARDNEDLSMLVCIIDCILACIESIIEYFNKWAYVYVGLYGYSYLEAGRNVITLFQNKGWTAIITDNLADNVLSMISVGIGLLTGLVGFLLGKADQNMFAGIGVDGTAGTTGFIIGLIVGFVFSSILMSVVSSAVNTVIVCFAEAPAEFDQNHATLSMEMRQAWRQAWPAECHGM